MNDIIKYIFGNLQKTEDDITNINKTIKSLKKTNGRLMASTLACIACIMLLDNQCKKNKAESEELRNEIADVKKRLTVYEIRLKSLETVKGEAKM